MYGKRGGSHPALITTNMKAATLLLCVLLPSAVVTLRPCRSVVQQVPTFERSRVREHVVSTLRMQLDDFAAASMQDARSSSTLQMQQQQSIQAGGTSIATPLVVDAPLAE